MLRRADSVTPISAAQNIYSMVDRDCERDIFPYCPEYSIDVVPFSPVTSGLPSEKVTAKTPFLGDDVRKFVPQLSPENLKGNQPIVNVVAQFAQKKNVTNA